MLSIEECRKLIDGNEEYSDEQIAEGLLSLGANVVEVPNYVAKRPFRVTVNREIGNRALERFKDRQLPDSR